ncbi:hypothetical protein FOPG_18282 [Fusarium oxysporum f. sp. conglutinans race 2 54008]|uniref:Uncharacterized protein n=1 Tax=Fusarium oxysporum f. sp. conglutinans race 2 54008 TaxID=1089457 RepID=X0GQ98_FUSOX|nr:hypothetical protein FOPG_18282 [Fusarium oxysporum f. sp. conglutinans race 2 54008]
MDHDAIRTLQYNKAVHVSTVVSILLAGRFWRIT